MTASVVNVLLLLVNLSNNNHTVFSWGGSRNFGRGGVDMVIKLSLRLIRLNTNVKYFVTKWGEGIPTPHLLDPPCAGEGPRGMGGHTSPP